MDYWCCFSSLPFFKSYYVKWQLSTYLLLWHLCILVYVQGFKQVCRSVLQPHKQVTRRHALLKAQQLYVKDQHGAARHTSSWQKVKNTTVNICKMATFTGAMAINKHQSYSRNLTSPFPMAKVRWHRYHPPLSHTHALQALIQPVDHFVWAQDDVLKAAIVVSEYKAS